MRKVCLFLFQIASLNLLFQGLSFGGAWKDHDILFPHPNAPHLERVTIPDGEFMMGADDPDHPERGPQHEVFLPAYQISRFEVTWADYQAFLDAGGYENPESSGFWSQKGSELANLPAWFEGDRPGNSLKRPQWGPDDQGPPGFRDRERWPARPNDPVVGVSIWEAEAFCRFVGGRLPTEAEWEKAAAWGPTASSPLRFPWGDEDAVPLPANGFEVSEGFSRIEAVDDPRYEGDVSAYGVRGMGGNVREWVADMYDPEFYHQGPADGLPWRDPFNLLARRLDYADAVGVNLPAAWGGRGGWYGHNTLDPTLFECAHRFSENVLARSHQIGFRVAWDTQAPSAPPTVIREKRPGAAVHVPSGSYLVGHSHGMPSDTGASRSEHPQHGVCLNEYWIGAFEVTWFEYRKFMELGGYGDWGGERPEWWSEEGWAYRIHPPCSAGLQELAVERPSFMGDPRPDFHEVLVEPTQWKGPWAEKDGLTSPPDDHPVFGLSWWEAEAFAKFVGGRLPTEVEWEVAATWNPETGRPQQYPWGNLYTYPFQATLANSGDDPKYPGFQTCPVGMFPEGKSPFGCYDMAGNVFEWCEDWASTESFSYHTSECGADLRTPDFLKIVPSVFQPCESDYWPVPGFKMTKGGGFDPAFVNVFAQRSRTRGDGFDGSQMFRNFTYGFRVVWDREPETIPEAQIVRPIFANGTDSPIQESYQEISSGPPITGTIKVVPQSKGNFFDGVIDVPGKEVWYRIDGPAGTIVEIDLDANGGSDDLQGFSPLDAVIEIWHAGIEIPVKMLDDELIPTGDVNLRHYYHDPPVYEHRIPGTGSFWVKVRAYSWPAEGSQAPLSPGERSYTGPEFSYRINFTGEAVDCQDPTADGLLDSRDLIGVVEGFHGKSRGVLKGDFTGDGKVAGEDLFALGIMWGGAEGVCKSSP